MQLLNFLVHNLLGYRHHNPHGQTSTHEISGSDVEDAPEETPAKDDTFIPPCCNPDPAGQIDRVQNMATQIREGSHEFSSEGGSSSGVPSPPGEDEASSAPSQRSSQQGGPMPKSESKKLATMSINTAMAIALHNFPEGLATFVAAVGDPAVGAALAIAIAIHNIPEGKPTTRNMSWRSKNRMRNMTNFYANLNCN